MCSEYLWAHAQCCHPYCISHRYNKSPVFKHAFYPSLFMLDFSYTRLFIELSTFSRISASHGCLRVGWCAAVFYCCCLCFFFKMHLLMISKPLWTIMLVHWHVMEETSLGLQQFVNSLLGVTIRVKQLFFTSCSWVSGSDKKAVAIKYSGVKMARSPILFYLVHNKVSLKWWGACDFIFVLFFEEMNEEEHIPENREATLFSRVAKGCHRNSNWIHVYGKWMNAYCEQETHASAHRFV